MKWNYSKHGNNQTKGQHKALPQMGEEKHKVWEALSHLAFLLVKYNTEDFQPFGNWK